MISVKGFQAFECPYHPLGLLLNDLTVAYTTTYEGTHHLLLSHAVNELHLIIKRLYDIVMLLFPALPPYGKDIALEESSDRYFNFIKITRSGIHVQ